MMAGSVVLRGCSTRRMLDYTPFQLKTSRFFGKAQYPDEDGVRYSLPSPIRFASQSAAWSGVALFVSRSTM